MSSATKAPTTAVGRPRRRADQIPSVGDEERTEVRTALDETLRRVREHVGDEAALAEALAGFDLSRDAAEEIVSRYLAGEFRNS